MKDCDHGNFFQETVTICKRCVRDANKELAEKDNRIQELVDKVFIIKRLATNCKAEANMYIEDLSYLPDNNYDEFWDDLFGVIKEALEVKE